MVMERVGGGGRERAGEGQRRAGRGDLMSREGAGQGSARGQAGLGRGRGKELQETFAKERWPCADSVRCSQTLGMPMEPRSLEPQMRPSYWPELVYGDDMVVLKLAWQMHDS
jgi:hypothetical protein